MMVHTHATNVDSDRTYSELRLEIPGPLLFCDISSTPAALLAKRHVLCHGHRTTTPARTWSCKVAQQLSTCEIPHGQLWLDASASGRSIWLKKWQVLTSTNKKEDATRCRGNVGSSTLCKDAGLSASKPQSITSLASIPDLRRSSFLHFNSC